VSWVERRDINVLAHLSYPRKLASWKHALSYEPQRIVAIKGRNADP
jgi:hypothetical protein